MSVPVSDDPEPEYLDVNAVAEYVGIKLQSLKTYASTGRLPVPDLVWLGHQLWLPATIDEWRANRYKRGPRPARQHRAPVAERPRRLPPKLAAPPEPERTTAKRLLASRPAATRAPAVSVVPDATARDIAARLRADGFYCTSLDVHELAGGPPPDDQERLLLQRRIEAKRRAL